MSQEFFENVPPELTINILSRLSFRAIACCKCVCKPWLDLIAAREFATLHLSNSAPILLFNPFESMMRIFELEDGPDLDLHHHDCRYKALTGFRFPREPIQIKTSVNGLLLLLLLRARISDPVVLYVCNPITREYIEIEGFIYSTHRELVTYGFGASKLTGQFKVVRIIHDRVRPRTLGLSKSECHVYTVGTGSWRSMQTGPPLDYSLSSGQTGAFCNGNLHWMVHDPKGLLQISCFDLETECFTTFCVPPIPLPPLSHDPWAKSLYAMEDRLCLCDNSSYDEIVIWSMKKYRDEKSWMKEFVITKNPGFLQKLLEPDYPNISNRSYVVHPIKVFKDGDMLMAWGDFFLLCYSNKAKTTGKIDMFKPSSIEICIKAVLHTPSFLSLSCFPLENVNSFKLSAF